MSDRLGVPSLPSFLPSSLCQHLLCCGAVRTEALFVLRAVIFSQCVFTRGRCESLVISERKEVGLQIRTYSNNLGSYEVFLVAGVRIIIKHCYAADRGAHTAGRKH